MLLQKGSKSRHTFEGDIRQGVLLGGCEPVLLTDQTQTQRLAGLYGLHSVRQITREMHQQAGLRPQGLLLSPLRVIELQFTPRSGRHLQIEHRDPPGQGQIRVIAPDAVIHVALDLALSANGQNIQIIEIGRQILQQLKKRQYLRQMLLQMLPMLKDQRKALGGAEALVEHILCQVRRSQQLLGHGLYTGGWQGLRLLIDFGASEPGKHKLIILPLSTSTVLRRPPMLTLYDWNLSPNCFKVRWVLAELSLSYTPVDVDIFSGQGQQADFLDLNPNGKVPVLKDGDTTLWESNAIILYLARKAGQLLPADPGQLALVDQWLHWQAAHYYQPVIGLALEHMLKPMFDQAADPQAVQGHTREFNRLSKILEQQLSQQNWLVGEQLSLADIALASTLFARQQVGLSLGGLPYLQNWLERLESRPAWQQAAR